jgi:signal transduction histidine kinase
MHDVKIAVLSLFILGAAVLAFIYHAVLLFFNRDKFLVHYLIYLFFTGIFLFAKTNLIGYFWGAHTEMYFLFYFKEAIQIIYLTSYFNFLVEAVGVTKKNNSFLFRNWAATIVILIAYSVIYSAFRIYTESEGSPLAFIGIRIFIFIVTGLMLYQSYKLRQIKFQLIILYGCTIYFIFGIISFVTNLYSQESWFIYPLEWLMIGSFIDIIFFSFAIGYRNRKQWESLNATLLEEANKLIGLQQVVLEKQKELENERNRIAADMHDDLGSGLTKITYLSQMALGKSDTEGNLTKINKTATELVENMSELIWVMKEENNTLEDLATYIKSYAVEYFENNNISVSIQIPELFNDIIINGNDRRNLFLSVKESLHNIVKHAHAKNVSIVIAIDSHLKIVISDDGIGLSESGQAKLLSGNGIKNMKSRIESMQGDFVISGTDGTQLCFSIPVSGMA